MKQTQRDPFIGKHFHHWTVIGVGTPNRQGRKRYCIQCDCGNTSQARKTSLVRGVTKSCRSCSQRGNKKGLKHGHMIGARTGKTSPTYFSWKNMTQRCTNPKHPGWKDYGGRGIKVYKGWRGPGGFERFLAHAGPRPKGRYSIGRVKNNKGYVPGNVSWQTTKQQANNKRTTRWITIDGKTQSVAEWAAHFKIDWKTVVRRYGRN